MNSVTHCIWRWRFCRETILAQPWPKFGIVHFIIETYIYCYLLFLSKHWHYAGSLTWFKLCELYIDFEELKLIFLHNKLFYLELFVNLQPCLLFRSVVTFLQHMEELLAVHACLAWFIWPCPHFHGSLVNVWFAWLMLRMWQL